MNELRITEIFYSLQGESRTIGLPTVFVRLTGCPLRCTYCDTEYAFHGGSKLSLEAILEQVASYKPRLVTVTGGEPLAQKNCWPLLEALCNQGYEVSLETSGAISVEGIDPRVIKVVDLKTPDSGEVEKNLYGNMSLLAKRDQVKFVISSRKDYDWASFKLDEYQLSNKVDDILFSPNFGHQDASELANWIVEDNLPVRFQLQLHKILWDDAAGR